MTYRDGPSGIGGWLAFYLVTVGLFSPLGTIFSLYGNLYANSGVAAAYGDRWQLIQIVEIAIAAVALIALYFTLWRFFRRRNWRTVQIAIGMMWANSIGLLLLETVAVAVIAGLDVIALLGDGIADTARGFAYPTIWTVYLLRSVRVANTYPRDGAGDSEDLVEVFE